MLFPRSLTLLTTALCATTSLARPAPQASQAPAASGGSYWMADISHADDSVWMNQDTGYKVFRDVTTYGADKTGNSDSTAAINRAMADGNRCGGPTPHCDSSTTTPAILYFPAGTYKISEPITMYYYTQMIGDANDLPILQATSDFDGIAVIDADPYIYETGANWFTNQNNFFRQVRNFKIDITQWGGGLAGAGIHWQIAQATSLQNIIFEMGDDPTTKQQGIFMDNGSGGFMGNLTFNNGGQCAFLGSQQFTSRDMVFNNCQTAIYMNWNWGWTIQGVTVNGGHIGLDMSVNPTNQSVGSVILADSTISNVDYGVRFAYQNNDNNMYPTGGTLILNNVDLSGANAGVVDVNNQTVLAPGKVDAWASGNGYEPKPQGTRTTLQGPKHEGRITAPSKAPELLDSNGDLYTKIRPQYETYPYTSFLSAKSHGCKGDGNTDDTAALNSLLQQAAGTDKIVYLEHGAYLVTDTIKVPAQVKVTGEIWPLILADGKYFNDASRPKPVFQVGQVGDTNGAVELSDIIFETKGPAPGAIMVEWNLQSEAGASGMWDCHVRIGGSAGTMLEGPEGLGGCRNNTASTEVNQDCEGVFMMFHATTRSGGIYLENTWYWVADHDLDHEQPKQISLYSGRGVLIQSQGPVWMWGTASEHSILYQYQFAGAKAVFIGFMQSETPYFQPNPVVPKPYHYNPAFQDPTFTVCAAGQPGASNDPSIPCLDAWGLRILASRNMLVYGTGLYSFFNNYDQTCVGQKNCQQNMIHIQNSQVDMFAVSTANSVNMILDNGMGTVVAKDNRNWFCDTISYYLTPR